MLDEFTQHIQVLVSQLVDVAPALREAAFAVVLHVELELDWLELDIFVLRHDETMNTVSWKFRLIKDGFPVVTRHFDHLRDATQQLLK